MAHVAPWKKKVVEGIVGEIRDYPVVAVVGMSGIPAPQVQSIRAGLRGHAKISMAKNKLLLLALEEASKDKQGLDGMKEAVSGQCAILTTDLNPFQIFKKLDSTMTPAAAKAGHEAPFDIVIPEGPTPFGPGPFLSELQKIGLPTQIKSGKIAIKKETTVVKAGEPISADVAAILPKLGIFPMIVGLETKAVYEGGVIYSKEVLDIPDGYYENMFATAARNALALGVEVAWYAKETAVPLLQKAYRSAYGLSVEAAIPTKETIGALFAKADRQMLAVASASGYTDDEITARLGASQVSAAGPSADSASAEQKAADDVNEENEKSEGQEEEEISAGLGALFG